MSGPAAMTYDTLLTDVISYTEKANSSNLTDQLPRLVMLAENRMATDLRILGVQQVVTGNFTAGDPRLAKPALWRKTVSFRYTNAANRMVELFLRTYEYCREYWPNQATATVAPRFYSDYNMANFLIAGTPSSALSFELTYVAKLAPLSSAAPTNWYTDGAPQLLLAATLLETEIWLKNQARVPQRQATYDSALAALKGEDGSRALDRSVVLM